MNIVVRIMKTNFNRPFWVIAIAAKLLADAVVRSLNMIVTICLKHCKDQGIVSKNKKYVKSELIKYGSGAKDSKMKFF